MDPAREKRARRQAIHQVLPDLRADNAGNAIMGEEREETLICPHQPDYEKMPTSMVLPIKKVFALVDSRITVEIKDEDRKFQGRLISVDEYLNIHMDETIELIGNERGRSLGTVVIRGNNILTISPVV
jgi:small nuclear ribonucleoprotein (snRNP)-like protein